jgi:hypothetical protein
MTGHLDPNPDHDYVNRMPDLLLNGCNLSDTLVFLPKLSDKTLRAISMGLIQDRKVFPDNERFQMAIHWHIVTVASILHGRQANV